MTNESDGRARGNNPELRGRPTRQTKLGLAVTKNAVGVEGDPRIITISPARDRPIVQKH
jgi:hypothetical protein